MLTEGFAVLVKELRVGSLQGPSELRGFTFADVDLVALRMDPKEKLFVGRRAKLLRDLLGSDGNREDGASGDDQSDTCKSDAIDHDTISPVADTPPASQRSITQFTDD